MPDSGVGNFPMPDSGAGNFPMPDSGMVNFPVPDSGAGTPITASPGDFTYQCTPYFSRDGDILGVESEPRPPRFGHTRMYPLLGQR